MIIRNSNIRRSLAHNRYKILGGIFAIILILCFIQMLNHNLHEKVEIREEERKETNIVASPIESSGFIDDKQTMIYGTNISSNNQAIYAGLIEEFIQACNLHETKKAYDLLTDECQEVVYGLDIALFEKNYINRVFDTKKTYSIQSWVNGKNTTYQVKIMQDILSTGLTDTVPIEDYYTIVKQGQEYKLNINGYIGREEVNTQKEQKGIQIAVLYKDQYREYEVYQLEVQNYTQNTILMDSKQQTDSVYLYGQNEESYPANMFEIDDSDLTIKPNEKRIINVTCNKRYTTTTTITHMVWKDVIVNEEEYRQTVDKSQYTNRISIAVPV